MSPPAGCTLPDLPAIAEMAGFGARFVYWKHVRDKGTGKRRKVPFQWNGKDAAKSNEPATWAALDALLAALPKRKVEGIGVMLGDLGDGRWLVGVDLDLCRSPVTGALEPWAQRWIERLRTYAEDSPSGTGVKLLGTVDRLPAALIHGNEPKGLEATPPGAAIPEGADGGDHDKPEIGLYPWRRFFTLTGRHLEGTPDELADITDAFAELAHEVAGMVDQAAPARSEPEAPPIDLGGLPAELREVVEADPKLKASWATGAKLTKGKDGTASGLEFSLVNHLAWRGHPDELIELAVQHYPYGQIGAGKLTGRNAERRIEKLLTEAAKIRERGERWQEAHAWFAELSCGENGESHDCLGNGALILRKDPAFAGRLRFDEHRAGAVCRDMPWRPGGDWREWQGIDDIRLADWCHQRGVRLRPATCADAVAAVADEHRVHPIRAWLDGLAWDGRARLDGWLRTCLGVTTGSDAYVREVGRRWLISAVARIYRPGCKADHALILEGPQGAGKSTALAALVPEPEWFADEISDLGSKDSAQDLRGKWLIELAELSALRRGEIERTKAFMSRQVDHYRPSYGRRSQDFPRGCVFAGTTNAEAYFGDETGNRRFWPVKVGTIDLATLRGMRDQLWAEALHAYRKGEKWWLEPEVERAAAEEQADRRIADPWETHLFAWLDARGGKPVSVSEALEALGVPLERRDQASANRVARMLRLAGWERFQRREGGARTWAYKPSPVSPVGQGHTGDEKASNGAAVTSVTSVTSTNQTHMGDTTRPAFADFNRDGGRGVPPGKFQESVVTGGDTGDACPDHDANDEPWWLGELQAARQTGQRNLILMGWARAAGGRAGLNGETLVAELPHAFLNCTIANLARRRWGWDVRGLRQ